MRFGFELGILPSKSAAATVSLHELTSGGYLRPDEFAAFSGMDVRFSVAVDETTPQRILIRVRLADDREIVAFADGSIAMLAR